jgi:hypothetical protein
LSVTLTFGAELGYNTGHTHEDIDQLFSVISRALINKHAVLPTVEDFEQFLENEVWEDSKPSIVRLHNVYDVADYYGDNINHNIRGLG